MHRDKGGLLLLLHTGTGSQAIHLVGNKNSRQGDVWGSLVSMLHLFMNLVTLRLPLS